MDARHKAGHDESNIAAVGIRRPKGATSLHHENGTLPATRVLRVAAAAYAMLMPKKLSKDEIVAMRHDYADGMPVEQITDKYKISRKILYYWLDGGPTGSSGATAAPKAGEGRA